MRRKYFASLVVVVALIITLSPLWAYAYDWPQFNFNAQHNGVDNLETLITPANVNSLQSKWTANLPDTADGAPAYLSAVNTASGVKNLLFLTTKAGRITARDAASGAEVWTKQAATGPRYTTSSPVIDPNRQFVYSYGLDGYVHKYQVGDGTEVIGGGWPQLATRKPNVEKGSAALALATARDGVTRLYVVNGGYPGDAGDYQGHLTTIDLNSGQQRVFNATCSNLTIHFVENGTPGVDDCAKVQTALWARPGIVYNPATDRIYMTTGNGDFSGSGGYAWGDTVFALNANGTGSNGRPLDSYTPDNYQYLDDADLDLGSTNPVILPMPAGSRYPNVAAQSGKEGRIHLINLDNMSGQGGVGNVGGEIQEIDVPQGGGVLPTPAAWVNPADGSTWLFVANGNGIAGLQVTLNGSTPQLTPRWNRGPGGSSPIIANGVLFYASNSNVYALNPTSGSQLWSGANSGNHWESPIVVNGTLYLSAEDATLTAFTLNGATPCTAGFNDVPNSNVFAAAIYNLACKGVVSGTSANRYSPAATATRAQFARMVVLGFGYALQTPATQTFTDVPPSYWAYTTIETAYANNIVGGYSPAQCTANNATAPCFLPNKSISRAELTIFVVRAARYPLITPTSPSFSDVPPNYYAYAAIETANSKGVVNGYPDNTFRPSLNIRRDEMAGILYKGINTPLASIQAQRQGTPSTHLIGAHCGALRPTLYAHLPIVRANGLIHH